MGALLGLLLAAQAPERVQGLALLAPALRFKDRSMALLRALGRVPFVDLIQHWVSKDATDLADPRALAEAPILRRWPIQRLRDLWTIQDRARAVLPKVRAPALIAVSSGDHVVSPEGCDELARGLIHARDVRVLRFDRGFHIMPRDLDRESVCGAVCEFFDRCRGGEDAEGEVRSGD
jgi:carboxylesterase